MTSTSLKAKIGALGLALPDAPPPGANYVHRKSSDACAWEDS
ncbi:MAG: hypothetical protein WC284_03480 [Candidimonas sp.]|jgi:hypothetical protein